LKALLTNASARSFPLHRRLHVGVFTFLNHAAGIERSAPQTGQVIVTGGAPTNGILVLQVFRNIPIFRKSLAVTPHHRIPALEPSQPQRHAHEVVRAAAGKGDDVPAGLEHAKRLAPHLGAGHPAIPGAAHEALLLRPVFLAGQPGSQAGDHVGGLVVGEAVGRIGDDGVDAVVGHCAQRVEAVADVEHRAPVTEIPGAHGFSPHAYTGVGRPRRFGRSSAT